MKKEKWSSGNDDFGKDMEYGEEERKFLLD